MTSAALKLALLAMPALESEANWSTATAIERGLLVKIMAMDRWF